MSRLLQAILLAASVALLALTLPQAAAAWDFEDCKKVNFQHPDCERFKPPPPPPPAPPAVGDHPKNEEPTTSDSCRNVGGIHGPPPGFVMLPSGECVPIGSQAAQPAAPAAAPPAAVPPQPAAKPTPKAKAKAKPAAKPKAKKAAAKPAPKRAKSKPKKKPKKTGIVCTNKWGCGPRGKG